MPPQLSKEHYQKVQAILERTLPSGTTTWVFGSRATGNTRRASDLDLAIDAGRPLTKSELSELVEQFEISDLPYKVDIIDYRTVTPEFRRIIDHTKIRWSGASA